MVPLSHCYNSVSRRVSICLAADGRAYVDAADQLPCTAVQVDARLGRAGPAICVQLLLIAIYGCRASLALLRAPEAPRRGCIPTYCAAVWGAHHVVLVELEVLVEDGRVELHLSVELVAHLLPVGGWLRHGDCCLLSCYHGTELLPSMLSMRVARSWSVMRRHGTGSSGSGLHVRHPR
jgi:hypothetical protein